MKTIRPKSDVLLVRLEPEAKRSTILEQVQKSNSRVGVVLDAGPGRYVDDHGNKHFLPTVAKVGDRVVFSVTATLTENGKTVTRSVANLVGDDMCLIHEVDVLCVIEDKDAPTPRVEMT